MELGNLIVFRGAMKKRDFVHRWTPPTSRTSYPFEQAPRRMATSASLGSSLPLRSDRTSWRSEKDDDSELPAAAHLHSCEYCPWGYFGNEGSEIDLYTYAALHIKIPPFGSDLRVANKSLKHTPVKRKRYTRSRSVKDD